MARELNRDTSVISRLFSQYPRATFVASEVILARTKLHSDSTKAHTRIVLGSELDSFIVRSIKQRYSPEQVAGRWVQQQKELHSVTEHLSKDTVYHFIYEHYPALIKKYFRRK
jgi:IS30 family transposase